MTDLLRRGEATLLASWEHAAQGSSGAALHRLPGVTVAVFPSGPEREFLNNALLARGLDAGARRDALDAMVVTYSDAGVERFAAWVHESDDAMRIDLERRGFRFDSSTRAMGADLDALEVPGAPLELVELPWPDHLRTFDFPEGYLAGADHTRFHLVCAALAGEPVSTALAFDHEGDCGIYNVTTLEHARRRGLGTAITARQLHDARRRGCTTASLQSTPMAERAYAAAGFRDLGRYLEYVP